MTKKIINVEADLHELLMHFKQYQKLSSAEEALLVFLRDSERFLNFVKLYDDLKLKMEEVKI